MNKWLFNPFVYIAGGRALLYGWAAMLLTAIVAYCSGAHFDGAIDMHLLGSKPAIIYLIEPLINWGVVALLFYIGGLVFSRSFIRIIDVAGTVALARWPMLFSAVTAFGGTTVHTDSVQVLISSITPQFVLLAMINVLLGIWLVALLYNAFRVSCNVKGGKGISVFIACLLAAEISTHIIIYTIYNHFI